MLHLSLSLSQSQLSIYHQTFKQKLIAFCVSLGILTLILMALIAYRTLFLFSISILYSCSTQLLINRQGLLANESTSALLTGHQEETELACK